MADIRTTVPGRGRVGHDGHCFALGGGTILGLRVVAGAGRAGRRRPPEEPSEQRTAAGLAARIGSSETSAP